MPKHPEEFKPNTYYWVGEPGTYHPLLFNVDKCWKLDGIGYIPHNKFMEIAGNKCDIIEAIPPA